MSFALSGAGEAIPERTGAGLPLNGTRNEQTGMAGASLRASQGKVSQLREKPDLLRAARSRSAGEEKLYPRTDFGLKSVRKGLC